MSTSSLAAPRSLSPLALGSLGLACTFVALGMGRFSFTPMMPMLIAEGVASPAGVNLAAALMMVGYTVGAIGSAWAGRRFGTRRMVRLALMVISAALATEALPLPLELHALMRFLCGMGGAVLIILAPSLLLQSTSADGRAKVAGLTYTGIGLGTLISGAVVPWAGTVATASLALAALSAVAMVSSYWLPAPSPPVHHAQSDSDPAVRLSWSQKLRRGWPVVGLVALAYALDAFAYVPHSALWGTFVAQEVGLGVTVAGHHWMLFGLGAICGPMLVARFAATLGFRRTLGGAMTLKAGAILLPWLTTAPWALALSITLVGALVPSVVALTSGRLAEIDPDKMAARWGVATSAFAIFQAAGGWIHASLYASFHSYLPLFPIAASVLAVGAVIVFLARESERT
jgi:predicted MFS family arabinose efflux permease